MSAQSMAAQGEKTRAKILNKLGKKPKTAASIASALNLSQQYVQTVLNNAVSMKKAEKVKQGRSNLYREPTTTIASAYKSAGDILG